MLCGGSDGRVQLLDLETGSLTSLNERAGGSISVCGFSANGQLIFATSADRIARLWETRKGERIAAFYAEKPITAGALASDGVTFVGGDARGRVFTLKLESAPGSRRKTKT